MGRYFNYTIMLVALAITLEITGFSSGTQNLLNVLGIDFNATNPFDWSSSDFWIKILAILTTGVIAGVTIGTLTRTSPENYIILPINALFTVYFIAVFGSVINYVFGTFPDQTWLKAIVLIIFGTLGVGYILTAIEWFRGTD